MDGEADRYRMACDVVLPKLLKLMREGRVRSIVLERHGSQIQMDVDRLGRRSVDEWHTLLHSNGPPRARTVQRPVAAAGII